MKNNDTPMWDNPAEPPYVRELLQIGRRTQVDYDAAQGLARHMALLEAGAALPQWAKGAFTAGASGSKIVAWVAVPVVAATVAATLWFAQQTRPEPTVTRKPAVEAAAVVVTQLPASPAPPLAAVEQAPPLAVAQPESSERMTLGSPHRLVPPTGKAVHVDAAMGAKIRDKRAARSLRRLGTRSASSLLSAPSGAAGAATQEVSAQSLTAPSARAVAPVEPVAAQAEALDPTTPPQAASRGASQVSGLAQPDDGRLDREMQMLAVAQRVLREDPERALRLARQGEHEFAGSMFSAERQQVAVLALVGLGRLQEARSIGQAFLSKYPNAPWSQRIRHALATGRID